MKVLIAIIASDLVDRFTLATSLLLVQEVACPQRVAHPQAGQMSEPAMPTVITGGRMPVVSH